MAKKIQVVELRVGEVFIADGGAGMYRVDDRGPTFCVVRLIAFKCDGRWHDAANALCENYIATALVERGCLGGAQP